MASKNMKIRATGGGEFDCYLSLPAGAGKVPAVVLASAIYGVDADVKGIADEFAAHGYIAAAPDLFSRSVPGALERGDPRSTPRGQPRLEKIKANEADMADTLAMVRALSQSNGRAASRGFCYGGPFAILGPAKLGYDAGIGCHSTQMKDYMDVMEATTKPVCLLWGDLDTMAPRELLEAYRALAAKKPNLELHIFPGILHSYMMPGSTDAYDAEKRAFSMQRALAILGGLRAPG